MPSSVMSYGFPHWLPMPPEICTPIPSAESGMFRDISCKAHATMIYPRCAQGGEKNFAPTVPPAPPPMVVPKNETMYRNYAVPNILFIFIWTE